MRKSAAIRKLLDENPGLAPKEIQAELSAKGIAVSRTLCKVVRHRAQGNKRARRSGEQKLRRNEAIVEHQVTRMSKADYAIWDRMKSHVALLSDKDREYELHSQQGSSMQRIPEIKEWLDAVSTWRARRRRQSIFRQFIYDLRTQYPRDHDPNSSIVKIVFDDEPARQPRKKILKATFYGPGLPKDAASRKATLAQVNATFRRRDVGDGESWSTYRPMKNNTWQIVADDIRTIEQDDDGRTYLWLAQESSKPVRYVTMVRSIDPHEEVYVERDEQRWACYGGIRRIELSPQGMVIHLNEKGQEKLGSSEPLDVKFDQEAQPDQERIRTLLGVLFGEGSPILSESR